MCGTRRGLVSRLYSDIKVSMRMLVPPYCNGAPTGTSANRSGSMIPCCSVVHVPVSYTHLDVYKRQVDLWKWLRGKKPDKVTQVGNNTEITFGENKKTVNNVVYNMYGDSAIRASFGHATEPLRRMGIDRISVKQDGTEQVAFEKDEASYFEAEPVSYTHLDVYKRQPAGN